MNSSRRHFHFMGICGTAMGAVAAALREAGHTVSGSDENVYPPMSTFLESKGITIAAGYSAENLPDHADVIVVGNAIKRGNPEVEAVLNTKRYYLSLPETLKEYFLRGRRNLVVTGTHGKTTTTSLLTWILESAGVAPSYLIGGIPRNLGQGAKFRDSQHVVLEGDEYDTAFFDKRSKFVHYMPELVIINNIEFDHADIFKDLEEIKLSFRRMLNIVPSNGIVLYNADDANATDVASTCPAPAKGVGLSEGAELRITDIVYHPGATPQSEFTLLGHRFTLPMSGEYNVRNAAMAAVAAHFNGVPLEQIASGIASFEGVMRRQEVRGEVRGIRIIDDFGHHPTAIGQALDGLTRQYPGSRLWAIFEPRSNTTRRAVFQHELPKAFQAAHGVLFSQVARLEQIPEAERLKPEQVIADIQACGKPAFYEPDVTGIIGRLRPLVEAGDTIVVFSNGGFDGIHQRLLTEL